jgi:hypothetical protein
MSDKSTFPKGEVKTALIRTQERMQRRQKMKARR